MVLHKPKYEKGALNLSHRLTFNQLTSPFSRSHPPLNCLSGFTSFPFSTVYLMIPSQSSGRTLASQIPCIAPSLSSVCSFPIYTYYHSSSVYHDIGRVFVSSHVADKVDAHTTGSCVMSITIESKGSQMPIKLLIEKRGGLSAARISSRVRAEKDNCPMGQRSRS